MKRKYTLYIEDILEAIQKIGSYTKGLEFGEFEQSNLIVDAVIRNLEVMGEAANKIPNDIRSMYPAIPWRNMIDFRNVLIHEYFGVDLEIIWMVLSTNLPQIKPLLEEMLDKEK